MRYKIAEKILHNYFNYVKEYFIIIKKGDAMALYPDIVDALCAIFEKKKLLNVSEISVLKDNFKKQSEVAFEDFLLEEGLLSKEQLLEALSELYQVPSLDVVGVFFEHHLVTMFPKDVMLRNIFIPYERDGDVLVVIAYNPNNNTLSEIIGNYVSYDATYFVGLPRDICDSVKEFFDPSIEEQEADFIPEEVKEKEEETSIDDIVNLE